MLYIVSGFMRTGTSMMMQALEAGGLIAAYSDERDKEMNARWGEPAYLPNDKYYELSGDDYVRGDLAKRYEGRLIKCLWGGILRLPPCEARIIFMRRPTIEIATSLLAFFGSDYAVTRIPDLDMAMENIVEILKDRRSFKTVDVIWYRDVIENPLKVFRSLNWPIDPAKAAKIPIAAKARFSNAGNS